jgi:3-oxoacyl-[acyl-carrier-protein] synthase-3
LGEHRPTRRVPNSEIVGRIDSTDEWVRSRSGIEARRRAADGESVVDMGAAAARDALAQAGVAAGDVGVVLVATMSHIDHTPAAAPQVADRIGARSAGAFDIGAACAGYCHAVAVADALVRAGAGLVLVIGAEKMSDLTAPDDRDTAFIFGDGAGAALVGPSESAGIGRTVWGADGSGSHLIEASPPHAAVRAAWESPDGSARPAWPHLRMRGPEVFRWAVTQMAPVARQALDAAGVGAADLDAFIPHQANQRITDALVKKLCLPAHVAVARDDIVEMGNTSAASIPLAAARLRREGHVGAGALALQIGFGAGLAYAAQVITLP